MFNQTLSKNILSAGAVFAILATGPAQGQEAWMIVTHEVEDFDRWQEVFEQALPVRRSVGEVASYIMRNPGEQKNVVTVWFEWDTVERARAWASDPALANGMTAAGVVSTPVFSIYEIETAN